MASVRDTGIGIRKENLKAIFDSFQRVDQKKTRTIEGTGLGLAICKRLCDSMGGKISVESEYGSGSEFTVMLPQKVIDWTEAGEIDFNEREAYIEDDHVYEGMHFKGQILVVDDVGTNLKITCMYLKDSGLEIDTAQSGRECLERIKERTYDVIFLDHMMPEMDGVETLKRIRETENPNKVTPVIMMTANAVRGAMEEYMAMGFDGYLSKPLDPRALDEMIARFIRPISEASVGAESTGDDAVADADKNDRLAPFKDVLDTETGLKYCLHDEDFYLEIIKTYVFENRLERLREAFVSEDWKSYRINIHAIKSTSINIGAMKMWEEARKMETAVADGDIQFVKENHPCIVKQYKKLIQNIDIWS